MSQMNKMSQTRLKRVDMMSPVTKRPPCHRHGCKITDCSKWVSECLWNEMSQKTKSPVDIPFGSKFLARGGCSIKAPIQDTPAPFLNCKGWICVHIHTVPSMHHALPFGSEVCERHFMSSLKDLM
jgi:hypothetical protein